MYFPSLARTAHPQAQGTPLRLVQLTDTHLCARPGGELLGVDTDFSLQQVIAQVRREQPEFDVLLATGDLADAGAPDAYKRLEQYLSGLHHQHYWLPGNHDNREQMAAVADHRLFGELQLPGWRVLMLDSQIPGEVGGALGDQQLAWLADKLTDEDQRDEPVLLCLHHQPVPIGSAWIDTQQVADSQAFFTLLADFPQVKGVLWGHVHQEVDLRHGELRLLASPSTCVQFAPGSERFQADAQAPGYRWLELHADGHIETGISRVSGVDFGVELDSTGY